MNAGADVLHLIIILFLLLHWKLNIHFNQLKPINSPTTHSHPTVADF